MTRTMLMWLWPVRMVLTWKPKRWSWKAPDNKQPSASIVISWRISSFSKIFLLRWKTKMRGIHLRPNFDEKQGTKSWIPREEKDFFLNLENREEKEKVLYKSWKSRGEREIVPQNLDNREEKGKLFYKILKIERRKRNCTTKSWKSRWEREIDLQNLDNREEKEKWFVKILKIERGTRHEISLP